MGAMARADCDAKHVGTPTGLRNSARMGPITGYFVALLVFGLTMRLIQVSDVPTEAFAAGILVAAVCLLPLTRWIVGGRSGVPIFELICLSYGVQYSLPLYVRPNLIVILSHPELLGWDQTTQCLLLVAAGVAAMILAFYAGRGWGPIARVPRFATDLPSRQAGLYAVLCLAFGVGALLLQIAGHSPDPLSLPGDLVRILSFQAYVALALLAFLHFEAQCPDRRRAALLFGGALALSALGFATGFLESALIPLLILLVVRWLSRRSVPWHWLLFSIVLFATADSVKAEYRAQYLTSGAPSSIPSRVTGWTSMAWERWSGLAGAGSSPAVSPLTDPALARLDLLHIFAWLHTATPATLPYYGGSTYDYFLYGWIPRVLDPGKPNAAIATRTFEYDYALLEPSQLGQASIGIGHPAEAYANFGPPGVVVVMFLEGLFIALLWRIFDVPGLYAPKAVYLAVLLTFLNGIGSYTAILVTGTVENVLVSVVLILLVRRGPASPAKVVVT